MIRSVNGKTPVIHDTAFVSEAAYVVGDVTLGKNSGIWPGAVVRGDFAPIVIGEGTMIEDNSVVHTGAPLEIGDNVIVGHGVVVHCKKIGNNCLIGNNATVLDDAVIGNNCVIGAGSLVRPGTIIPDNSFVVGVPAEIKKKIPETGRRNRTGGLTAYITLMQQYKKQGL